MKKLILALCCLLVLIGCGTPKKDIVIKYTIPPLPDLINETPIEPASLRVDLIGATGITTYILPETKTINILRGWTGTVRLTYNAPVFTGLLPSGESCPTIAPGGGLSCWIVLGVKRSAVTNPLTGELLSLTLIKDTVGGTDFVHPQNDPVWWTYPIEKDTPGQVITVEFVITTTDWR